MEKISSVKDMAPKPYNLYSKYIETGCDNLEESQEVLRLAGKIILENLKLDFTNAAGELYLANIFYVVWHNVVDYLASRVNKDKVCKLNIANLVQVGFTDGKSEDETEQGNFVPTIEHLSAKLPSLDGSATDVQPAASWCAKMVTSDVDVIRVLSQKTYEYFKNECDLILRTSELIFPIFGYIYSALIEFMTIKRDEIDDLQYRLDFLNCFYISAFKTQDGDTIFGFEPKQMQKLSTKSDGDATSVNE